MSNFNKIYHKGKYRNGEWGKHLRPYQKRIGNKRWRKTAKNSLLDEEFAFSPKRIRPAKQFRFKITLFQNGFKKSYFSSYRTWRGVEQSFKRTSVIRIFRVK